MARTLAHRIRLKTTPEIESYFVQACGTARKVYNWALNEWNRQHAAHLEDPSLPKPSIKNLKRQFNAIKYTEYPWMKDIHRDTHARPFTNLGHAFSCWFEYLRKKKQKIPGAVKVDPPTFKKKGKSRDSFYVANDQFSVAGKKIRLPKIGWMRMTEAVRFPGKIMSAVVSRTADHWYISFSVQVDDATFYRTRTKSGLIGVDLGIKTAVVCSDGNSFFAPKPLKAATRRLRIRQRRLARKQKKSKNAEKMKKSIARLHARVAALRHDWLHKVTTQLCRENRALGLENLNVAGMLRNHRLARALADIGFGEFRRQILYKILRYIGEAVLYPRFEPSSKKCHVCGHVLNTLKLSTREWDCPDCGTHHDRDFNASKVIEIYTEENKVMNFQDNI